MLKPLKQPRTRAGTTGVVTMNMRLFLLAEGPAQKLGM